jgi:hypothetical protein
VQIVEGCKFDRESKTRVQNSTANRGHPNTTTRKTYAMAELVDQCLDGLRENFGVAIDVGGGGGGGHKGHVVEWS